MSNDTITTTPEAATCDIRSEFLDALEAVNDDIAEQSGRLAELAALLTEDNALIDCENAGFYVARLLGVKGPFLGLTYASAANLVLRHTGAVTPTLNDVLTGAIENAEHFLSEVITAHRALSEMGLNEAADTLISNLSEKAEELQADIGSKKAQASAIRQSIAFRLALIDENVV